MCIIGFNPFWNKAITTSWTNHSYLCPRSGPGEAELYDTGDQKHFREHSLHFLRSWKKMMSERFSKRRSKPVISRSKVQFTEVHILQGHRFWQTFFKMHCNRRKGLIETPLTQMCGMPEFWMPAFSRRVDMMAPEKAPFLLYDSVIPVGID